MIQGEFNARDGMPGSIRFDQHDFLLLVDDGGCWNIAVHVIFIQGNVDDIVFQQISFGSGKLTDAVFSIGYAGETDHSVRIR